MRLFLQISIILISLTTFINVLAEDIGGQSVMVEKFKDKLNKDQYDVLFCEATEQPFSSELLYEKRSGKFVCAVCGNEIFESGTKYDSHTGWPSFYNAIEGSVEVKVDRSIGHERTEFHCSICGGHFGHVFDDGPEPTGKRYCTNGLALKFIPDEEDGGDE